MSEEMSKEKKESLSKNIVEAVKLKSVKAAHAIYDDWAYIDERGNDQLGMVQSVSHTSIVVDGSHLMNPRYAGWIMKVDIQFGRRTLEMDGALHKKVADPIPISEIPDSPILIRPAYTFLEIQPHSYFNLEETVEQIGGTFSKWGQSVEGFSLNKVDFWYGPQEDFKDDDTLNAQMALSIAYKEQELVLRVNFGPETAKEYERLLQKEEVVDKEHIGTEQVPLVKEFVVVGHRGFEVACFNSDGSRFSTNDESIIEKLTAFQIASKELSRIIASKLSGEEVRLTENVREPGEIASLDTDTDRTFEWLQALSK